jgi:hypothetical protein
MTNAEFDKFYLSTPDGRGGVTLTPRRPIRTRDADSFPVFGRGRRTHSPSSHDRGFWLALRGALSALNIRTADAEQVEKELRGVARTHDDIATGNDPSPKRIGFVVRWTGTAEELRDAVNDPVEPLQSSKNLVLGEVLGPEDVEDYTAANGRPPIDLGMTYEALSQDARAWRARDVEAAAAAEAEAAAHLRGPTRDGRRPMGGSALFAAAARHSVDSVARLVKGRAELTAKAQAAPVAKARVTGTEFANLHDKSALRRRAAERQT